MANKKKAIKKAAKPAKKNAKGDASVLGRGPGRPAKTDASPTSAAVSAPKAERRLTTRRSSREKRESASPRETDTPISRKRFSEGTQPEPPKNLTNLCANYEQPTPLAMSLLTKWRLEAQKHNESVSRQIQSMQRATADVGERLGAHTNTLEAIAAKIERIDESLKAFAEKVGTATEDIRESFSQLAQQFAAQRAETLLRSSPQPLCTKVKKSQQIASPRSGARLETPADQPKLKGKRGRKSLGGNDLRVFEGEHPNVYSSEKRVDTAMAIEVEEEPKTDALIPDNAAIAKKASNAVYANSEGGRANPNRGAMTFLAPRPAAQTAATEAVTPRNLGHNSESSPVRTKQAPLLPNATKYSESVEGIVGKGTAKDGNAENGQIQLGGDQGNEETGIVEERTTVKILAHPLLPNVRTQSQPENRDETENPFNKPNEKRDFF